MLPENESEPYLTKEEIELKLDKIPELEKKLDRIENRLETLIRSNKSQHDKMWLKFGEGEYDV